MAFKQRTYTEVPHDEDISPQIREFLASLLSQVNALSGKGVPPAGQGIQALSQNNIDPTTGQITSAGSRVSMCRGHNHNAPAISSQQSALGSQHSAISP